MNHAWHMNAMGLHCTTVTCVLMLLYIINANGHISEEMRCKRGGYNITVPGDETLELTINTEKWNTTQFRCVINVARGQDTIDRGITGITWKLIKYKIHKQCANRNCKCQPLLYIDESSLGHYTHGAAETADICFDPAGPPRSFPKREKSEQIKEIKEIGETKKTSLGLGLTIFVQKFNKSNHLYAVIALTTEKGELKKLLDGFGIAVFVVLVVVTVTSIAISTIGGKRRRRRMEQMQAAGGMITNAPPGFSGFPPPHGQPPVYPQQSGHPSGFHPQPGQSSVYPPQPGQPRVLTQPPAHPSSFHPQTTPAGQPSMIPPSAEKQPIPQDLPPKVAPDEQPPPYENQTAPAYTPDNGPPGLGYPPGQGSPTPGYPPSQYPPAPGYPSGQPPQAPGYPPGQPPQTPGYPTGQPPPAPGYPPGQPPPAPGYPPGQPQPAPPYPPNDHQYEKPQQFE